MCLIFTNKLKIPPLQWGIGGIRTSMPIIAINSIHFVVIREFLCWTDLIYVLPLIRIIQTLHFIMICILVHRVQCSLQIRRRILLRLIYAAAQYTDDQCEEYRDGRQDVHGVQEL